MIGVLMVDIKTVQYNQDITKIGIVSDTHIPTRGQLIPPKLFKIFEEVQLILHAGDLVDEMVLDELRALAPVEAVAGNMDPGHLQIKLGKVKVIRVGDIPIGLVHGDFSGRRADLDRLVGIFKPVKPRAVVFGHLHEPLVKKREGTLFFNPGSVIDPRRNSKPSCGLLSIKGEEVKGEIFYV